MVIPINPGHWQHFILRNDNKNHTVEQMRQKYLKEQINFEQYMNFVESQKELLHGTTFGGGQNQTSAPSYDLTFIINVENDGNYFRFVIGTIDEGTTDVTIVWGDGNTGTGTIAAATTEQFQNTYTTAGIYTVGVNFTNPENVYSITADQND